MQGWLEKWEPRVVTIRSEEQASRLLIKPGEYCSWENMDSSRRAAIDHCIRGKMSTEQADSLRQQLLVEKCRLGSIKIAKFLVHIVNDYETGVCLLDIARRYDVAPIAIFRSVLSARLLANWRITNAGEPAAGFDTRSTVTKRLHKKMVTEALRGRASDLLPLSARDISELAHASNADAASFEGIDPRQKEIADAFEAVIGKVRLRSSKAGSRWQGMLSIEPCHSHLYMS
jgi:hypothetical protein